MFLVSFCLRLPQSHKVMLRKASAWRLICREAGSSPWSEDGLWGHSPMKIMPGSFRELLLYQRMVFEAILLGQFTQVFNGLLCLYLGISWQHMFHVSWRTHVFLTRPFFLKNEVFLTRSIFLKIGRPAQARLIEVIRNEYERSWSCRKKKSNRESSRLEVCILLLVSSLYSKGCRVTRWSGCVDE